MICPELICDYSRPAIKWHQTDLMVVVSIQLTDVSDYYLQIKDDLLQFSTKVNSKEYYLLLYLFGSVVAERTVHKNVGREIKIYLVKGLKWYPWLRLIKSKEKNPLISYNLEYIYETESVYKNKFEIGRFERYKRENHVRYIMPVVPSSDEEESEDEDFMDFSHFA